MIWFGIMIIINLFELVDCLANFCVFHWRSAMYSGADLFSDIYSAFYRGWRCYHFWVGGDADIKYTLTALALLPIYQSPIT